jgi:hypothetical protein
VAATINRGRRKCSVVMGATLTVRLLPRLKPSK